MKRRKKEALNDLVDKILFEEPNNFRDQ